jgi:hypothetical protein
MTSTPFFDELRFKVLIYILVSVLDGESRIRIEIWFKVLKSFLWSLILLKLFWVSIRPSRPSLLFINSFKLFLLFSASLSLNWLLYFVYLIFTWRWTDFHNVSFLLSFALIHWASLRLLSIRIYLSIGLAASVSKRITLK